MKTAKAGLIYFATILGVGFALGTVRVFLVAPRVGARAAELMEEPIMLVVIILAARWLMLHFTLETMWERLGAGIFRLGLLLAAEYALLRTQGLSLRQDIARRETVAGVVYLAMLLVLAVTPALGGVEAPRDLVVRVMRRIEHDGYFHD